MCLTCEQVVLSGLAIEDFARPAAEGVSRYMAQSFAPSDSSLISFHMVSIIDRKVEGHGPMREVWILHTLLRTS